MMRVALLEKSYNIIIVLCLTVLLFRKRELV